MNCNVEQRMDPDARESFSAWLESEDTTDTVSPSTYHALALSSNYEAEYTSCLWHT